MDVRRKALEKWLKGVLGSSFKVSPMVGDASFRRYFRISQQKRTYVAMDAGVLRESCVPFVGIADALRSMGLCTPEIVQQDLDQGFLLLSDLGTHTYLDVLDENNAEDLYGRALDALSVLQGCRTVSGWTVPPFTAEFMWQEWGWFKEWFLDKYLHITPSSEMTQKLDYTMELLIDAALSQPHVFMHRDYHSANLMVLDKKQVGILDFQDAFIGPVSYDLVSLLRDCYIAWPEQQVLQWVNSYWERLVRLNVVNVNPDTFLCWFDWMGVQRHLKALLTFARKYVRDNDARYLQHIPRTLNYLTSVSSRYTELVALNSFLQDTLLPAYKTRVEQCEV